MQRFLPSTHEPSTGISTVQGRLIVQRQCLAHKLLISERILPQSKIDTSHSSSASRPANTKLFENGHAKNIEQGCLSTAISGSHQRCHMAHTYMCTCSMMHEMQRQQDASEAKSLGTYCMLRHFSRCWTGYPQLQLTWDIEQLHIEDYWRSWGHPRPATKHLVSDLQETSFHISCAFYPTQNCPQIGLLGQHSLERLGSGSRIHHATVT